MEEFVDYYERLKISPVSQNISDLRAHFARRNGLYRNLGIPPGFVKGKSVIEFGPGSGYNSIHTAALGPSRYVLVDGNTTGISNLKNLFSERDIKNAQVFQSMIEDFQSDALFDLVVCEGTLPFQSAPDSLFNHMSSFVSEGGIFVCTCIDAVSYFPECLRRFFSRVITNHISSIEEQKSVLVEMLGSHLATLDGMTRPHEDWVLDNILQPFSGRSLFGIGDLSSLLDGFSFYCSSPQFKADWRWYKKLGSKPSNCFSDNFLEAYWENLHKLIDWRFDESQSGDPEHNKLLLETCSEGYEVLLEIESTDMDLVESSTKMSDVVEAVMVLLERYKMDTTISGFESYSVILKKLINCLEDKSGLEELSKSSWGEFEGLFGRGQQYISLINDL